MERGGKPELYTGGNQAEREDLAALEQQQSGISAARNRAHQWRQEQALAPAEAPRQAEQKRERQRQERAQKHEAERKAREEQRQKEAAAFGATRLRLRRAVKKQKTPRTKACRSQA